MIGGLLGVRMQPMWGAGGKACTRRLPMPQFPHSVLSLCSVSWKVKRMVSCGERGMSGKSHVPYWLRVREGPFG